jgi:hypothetical protein
MLTKIKVDPVSEDHALKTSGRYHMELHECELPLWDAGRLTLEIKGSTKYWIRSCHRGGPGSSPGQSMWDLWWTKWHWGTFLLVLRFPLPILIPPTAPHSSSSIIRGWYNRQISGRRTKWTQSHPTPRNSKRTKSKYWIGGSLGYSASLGVVVKGEICYTCWIRNLVVQITELNGNYITMGYGRCAAEVSDRR